MPIEDNINKMASIGHEQIMRALQLEIKLDQCHIILGWAFQQIGTSSKGAITADQIVKIIEELSGTTHQEALILWNKARRQFGYVPGGERFITSPTSE